MRVDPRFQSILIATCILVLNIIAQASSENVLHTFANSDGSGPYNGVVFDAAGNLYGTTISGGSTGCGGYGCGVVFKLIPQSGGGWAESAIYTFTGAEDGEYPDSPLILDAVGNLYGTTTASYSGTGQGTVFQLTPRDDGSWSFSVIHTFTGGKDGADPYGPLVLDSAGNLFGTTGAGGLYNSGIAFELSPTSSGKWKETLLHTFTGGSDGQFPNGLAVDAQGNIYGGAYTNSTATGVVFSLATSGGQVWKETILRRFSGGMEGGGAPYFLAFDSSGNLYGTASGGNSRCAGGCGIVFQLTRSTAAPWEEKVLFYFNGEDGLGAGGLVFGSSGNLYGWAGPSYGSGLIFSMAPDDDWAETPVFVFSGDGGYSPDGPITLNPTGHLFGTTVFGGNYDAGLVYEITP